MPNTLQGKTVAILATNGFEQSELIKPKQALEEAGARTQVVSPAREKSKVGTTKTGARRSRLTFR